MTTTTPVPVDNNILTQRRAAVSNSTTVTGLDYVEYIAATSTEAAKLQLNFIPKNDGIDGLTIPAMSSANIQITVKTLGNAGSISSFVIDPNFSTYSPTAIAIYLTGASIINPKDNSIFTLSLVQSSGGGGVSPLPGVDVFLFTGDFAIVSNSQAQFDGLQPTTTTATTVAQGPEIDYLSRDYLSFRQLMLGRLSNLIPDWEANNEADLGGVIIEVLAYVADYLSYYQDAVVTESYLGTARSRISLKRHARLLDYIISEGCNARLWACVELDASQFWSAPLSLKQYTLLFSLGSLTSGAVAINGPDETNLLADPNVVQFATMYPVTLYPANNQLNFYTWGSQQFSLAVGATSATLQGKLGDPQALIDNPKSFDANTVYLQKGDVLIFSQVKTTDGQLADPTLRCAVRLETVTAATDPLFLDAAGKPTDVIEITWSIQDALTFEIPVTATLDDGTLITDMSLVYGNAVLADQGKFIDDDPLSPNIVPQQGIYRPTLNQNNLTFYQPFDNATAITNGDGASQATQQDLQSTIPYITLKDINNGQLWNAKQDLLDSNYLSPDFVVEVENNRQAFIRFGDGQFGALPTPGDTFIASYRVSNGSAGNIGADSLAYISVDADLQPFIRAVSNPLQAQGGTDPESNEQVKLYAPKAFAQQERCVTVADYIQVTQQYSYRNEATGQDSNVNSVNALLRWTGSWNTVFIAVALKGGGSFDDDFKQDLLNYLAGFELMHHDIELLEPQWVPLTITLPITVESGYSSNVVQYNLIQRFSSTTPDGFFYPDNFLFGQPVYLSNIIGAAMEVAGVASVNISDAKFQFQRFGQNGAAAQKIDIGPLEIAQLNAMAPGQGTIQFIMSTENNT
jgi:hypothetical protein